MKKGEGKTIVLHFTIMSKYLFKKLSALKEMGFWKWTIFKGGKFAEALLEAKEGTILAPSDEAFEKVDKERLDFIIGNDYLRAEMLGLHFVRERITSTDRKIQGSEDMVILSKAYFIHLILIPW